jgi:predicted ThiF/HesA family dinucleotide-utilizing enzyme
LESENWHPDTLQNRGRVDKTLRKSEIVLIGCGALGANVAEQLVRMGVSNLTVVDKELFSPGNIVRHTLTVRQINESKAVALAKHLNEINPSASIAGLMLSIPSKDKTLTEALSKATLLIDCSADDGLMSELPLLGLSSNAKIISCSTGLHANKLFFYANTAESFSDDEFNTWFQPFREQEHILAQKEDLPRGAGCWNPVTPAKLNRIAGLSAIAVELIEQVILDDITETVEICHEWQVPSIKLLPKRKAA